MRAVRRITWEVVLLVGRLRAFFTSERDNNAADAGAARRPHGGGDWAEPQHGYPYRERGVCRYSTLAGEVLGASASILMRGASGIEDPWMWSREHLVLISCLC